jgi:hypothetical protein
VKSVDWIVREGVRLRNQVDVLEQAASLALETLESIGRNTDSAEIKRSCDLAVELLRDALRANEAHESLPSLTTQHGDAIERAVQNLGGISECARRLEVAPNTVRAWLANGIPKTADVIALSVRSGVPVLSLLGRSE